MHLERWLRSRRFLLMVAVAGGLACSGEGASTVPPGAPASVSLVRTGASSAAAGRGEAATYAFSVTRSGGYSGTVQLTAENLPAGVTATFSPASLGSSQTTAALSLVVDNIALPGAYPVTIRATGTGIVARTLGVELVIPPPSLSLTASLGHVVIVPGKDTTLALTLVRGGGYTGTVFLTLPPDLDLRVVADVDPEILPPGVTTSILTIRTLPTAAGENGGVQVEAAGAGGVRTQAAVNYTVLTSSVGLMFLNGFGELRVASGQTTTRAIIIARQNDFAGRVTFHFEDAPPGMSGSFDPVSILDSQTILAVDVSSDVPVGTYHPTLRASGNGIDDVRVRIPVTVWSPP